MSKRLTMEVNLNGKLRLLGDPHIGRAFTGLNKPAREFMIEQQWAAIHKSLNQVDEGDLHVCMGDLFDKPKVSNEDLWEVANMYGNAIYDNPGVTYMVLAGNHDLSKDTNKVSSLMLLDSMVPELCVIMDTTVQKMGKKQYLFLPYSPFGHISYSIFKGERYDGVFTHGNTGNYGNENIEVLNLDEISKLTNTLYNGHEHVPCEKKHGSLKIINVGSMLPYNFAEDREGKYFVERDEANLDRFGWKNKIVRVLYEDQPPEMPNFTDALQVTLRKKKSEAEVTEVELEDEFDLKTVYDKAMKEHKVSKPVQLELWDVLNDQ